MPKPPAEMLKGTLDLLVLRTLELQPLHGIAIADRIHQVTGGTFDVGPGLLFPALHRLERAAGHAASGGFRTRDAAPALYTLTAAGRRQLAAGRKAWARIVAAVGQVLDSA